MCRGWKGRESEEVRPAIPFLVGRFSVLARWRRDINGIVSSSVGGDAQGEVVGAEVWMRCRARGL